MNTDNLITPEDLAARLKMAAEGMKKKPGMMKSTVGYMELLHKYVERIATAKDKGKFVVDPRHPAAARDLRGDGRGGRLQRILGRHLRRRGCWSPSPRP